MDKRRRFSARIREERHCSAVDFLLRYENNFTMKTLLIAMLMATPLFANTFHLSDIESLKVEDVTGTGVYDVTFSLQGTRYRVDTTLTSPFILEQCLESIRVAMNMTSGLSVKVTASGKPQSLLLYGCELSR